MKCRPEAGEPPVAPAVPLHGVALEGTGGMAVFRCPTGNIRNSGLVHADRGGSLGDEQPPDFGQIFGVDRDTQLKAAGAGSRREQTDAGSYDPPARTQDGSPECASQDFTLAHKCRGESIGWQAPDEQKSYGRAKHYPHAKP